MVTTHQSDSYHGKKQSMTLPTKITDPVTGEHIVFDESASSDTRLVWDEWRPANSDPPPAHYHPETEERFIGRDGSLVVQLDGTDHRIAPGEEIVVPPGIPHVSYTANDPARFRREVSPPGRWREFLTARFAASHAVGGLSGPTGFLQLILLLQEYSDIVVPEQPPRPVQRVLFPVLAALARAAGKPLYYPYPVGDDGVDGATRS